MATRGAGSAPAVADRFARLPLVALVSSLVVGPLGSGLGVWAVVRSRRAGRPNPALAVAARPPWSERSVLAISTGGFVALCTMAWLGAYVP